MQPRRESPYLYDTNATCDKCRWTIRTRTNRDNISFIMSPRCQRQKTGKKLPNRNGLILMNATRIQVRRVQIHIDSEGGWRTRLHSTLTFSRARLLMQAISLCLASLGKASYIHHVGSHWRKNHCFPHPAAHPLQDFAECAAKHKKNAPCLQETFV